MYIDTRLHLGKYNAVDSGNTEIQNKKQTYQFKLQSKKNKNSS